MGLPIVCETLALLFECYVDPPGSPGDPHVHIAGGSSIFWVWPRDPRFPARSLRTSVLDLKFLFYGVLYSPALAQGHHRASKTWRFAIFTAGCLLHALMFPRVLWGVEVYQFLLCLIFDTCCCFFANISSSAILDRHVFQRNLQIQFVQFATFVRRS